MEDNIIIENVEFSQELYEKNMRENVFENSEYEAGEDNANN